jgi:DNA-directed RNA polymerase subunit alpha
VTFLTTVPKIERVETGEKYGRFQIEPLEKGMGITLGNALRRMLLGALPGAAVTWVNITGIQHEFSTIPQLKEDTMDLLLNVKALRLKSLSGKPGKLMLDVSGEGQIYAADITPTDDFEVVNPNLYLATLDSPDAKLTIEFNVELGQGYREAAGSANLPVSAIPVDAVFSPMKKVNFAIQPIHFGRETSRERLTIEIWTDGTIEPVDAISKSAAMLVEMLTPIVSYSKAVQMGLPEEQTQATVHDERFSMPIEELDLSVRTLNALRRADITTLGELLTKEEKDLLALRNFGAKSKQEIVDKLTTMGLSLVNKGAKGEPGEESSTYVEEVDEEKVE